ncbi:MAG TPA: hypothetical protein VF715_11635 [Thermoleophilaceae bacterium]
MTLALAALVAALPAAAIAQDAGSNQYQDPLAGEPGTGSSGSGGGNGSSGGGGGGGGNTTPSNGGGTQNVQSESGTGTEPAQARDQLPATGVDAWMIAYCGAALFALGLGLRLRLGARPAA